MPQLTEEQYNELVAGITDAETVEASATNLVLGLVDRLQAMVAAQPIASPLSTDISNLIQTLRGSTQALSAAVVANTIVANPVASQIGDGTASDIHNAADQLSDTIESTDGNNGIVPPTTSTTGNLNNTDTDALTGNDSTTDNVGQDSTLSGSSTAGDSLSGDSGNDVVTGNSDADSNTSVSGSTSNDVMAADSTDVADNSTVVTSPPAQDSPAGDGTVPLSPEPTKDDDDSDQIAKPE